MFRWMMRPRVMGSALVLGLLLALGSFVLAEQLGVWAHGEAPEYVEVWSGTGRLFVADNARNEILVVDLPDGQVTAQIQVPPKTMSMGATPDGAYVVVTRGRDADRQHVTVIATAMDKDGLRRPYVSKTLLLGKAIGGIHGDHLSKLWGKLVLVTENEGKVHRFDPGALDGKAAFDATVLNLGMPDHYDLVEIGERVWAGGIRSGVRLLDQQGKEVAKFPCNANHGIVTDAKTNRTFGACAEDLLVIEGQTLKTRIPYPISERIGAFTRTKGGLFGSSEGVQNLQLIDPQNLTLTPVSLKGTLYAHATTRDDEQLLVLLQNGMFQVRDGVKGDLMREVRVSTPFPEWDEDVSGAVMPNIVVTGNRAYVSIPQRGMIAEVDWKEGKLLRNLMVGGMPTRLVLLDGVK